MTVPVSGPTRLGWFVKQGRTRLRLSQSAAARRAGISRPVWAAIETGITNPYDTTYVGVEETLHWAPGSCITTRDGGVPTELPSDVRPATLDEQADALEQLAAELEGMKDGDEHDAAILRILAAKLRGKVQRDANGPERASG